ncbi:hypothetical protein ABL78_6512 [Leptomonas seymouri]|uniref:Uncharacterized protein n=1 Tax=Leptomonas seymouri TaxID=5684 RepID=A0A0N1I386_LEPSE|nr:hypothetical protein ABL78_6512 [Leptomonas seymouri]|eukprot:KPI84430.1 hypothetical protein ABL78_6512 [Leptomonas seymouri]
MVAESAASGVDVTPVRRRLGTSTDDAAIFFEDTVDRATAQCIDASPSAMALLTPQRMPSGQHAHVDVTEYDASHLGSLSTTRCKSSSSSKGRLSGQRSALHDVTNTSSAKMSSSTGASSKSPTPKPARLSSPQVSHSHRHAGSHSSLLMRSTPRHSTHDRSPSAAEPTVSLADYEALQKERNRFEKMYEHQRALYEEMAEKQAETYQALQDKIIEVVALSTRNEESKRFIRQLKREFSESRTRVMDMQNKALEEAKAERNAKSHYEALIREQERKYDRLVERHETKLAGMESLVKDLTKLRGEQDQLHVSQLDSLLKAAYSKSTALFSDLLRQERQIDLLYDAKGDVESQLEQLRREKRDMERVMREERRRTMAETERLIEQIEEQQQSILNLRQMLIRTMDNRDEVFAYCRGPRRAQRHGEFEETSGVEDVSQASSNFSSSPPSSIAEEDEEDRFLGGDDFTDESGESLMRQEASGDGAADPPHPVEEGASAETTKENCVDLSLVSAATRLSRGGQNRPVISASATTSALTSNTVVMSRLGGTSTLAASSSASNTVKRSENAPPLPLSSRAGGGGDGATDFLGAAPSTSSSATLTIVRQERPHRFKRSDDNKSGSLVDSEGGDRGRGVGARIEDDDAHNGRAGAKTAGSITRGPLSRSNSSLASPTREKVIIAADRESCGNGSGALRERDDFHASSSSPASAGAGSRRRLDFTTALAAVAEKRQRDRAAREERADRNNGNHSGNAHEREKSSSSNAPVSTARAEHGKGNGNAAGGRRVIVRSGTVGSITTARTTSGASREVDDEEEPRLFPQARLCTRE